MSDNGGMEIPVKRSCKIAFLGPEGTFSEEALGASSSEDCEHVQYSTIYECILAVQEGEVEQAFVPIENSLEGSVTVTLDALAFDAPDVQIVREVTHPIRLSLIAARALELDQVTRVISIPMVKAQCRRFIHDYLPLAELAPANSTAEAVRTVSRSDEPWAALGNELAAELYSCQVLHSDVQDSPDNETRFVYVARGGVEASAVRSRSWKTSIVCSIASDHPGALLEILEEFAKRDINLSKIESRPAKTGLGAYVFFIDIEGGQFEASVGAALEALAGKLKKLRVLGTFPA